MNVYMIEGDGDYFGASLKDVSQSSAFLNSERRNRPVSPDLTVVGWYYPDEGKIEPVFSDFGLLTGGTTLLLRRPRTDVLLPMLRAVGTTLPMTPWRGECFQAFICDTQLDAMDPDRTKRFHEDHEFFANMIRRYAFRTEALHGATVFKVSGLFGRLFATDRFVDLVQENTLLGLQVLPVWSSDTGPIGYMEDPVGNFDRYPPGFGRTPAEKRARMRALLQARDGDADLA